MNNRLLGPLLAIGCSVLLMLMIVLRPHTIEHLSSEYVSIDDSTKVHYKTDGNGPRAIVFVHGFGCNMATWEQQYEALRHEDNLQMVFVDLPGYGESDKPHTEYTLRYLAAAVKAVVEKEGLQHPVLVGHSLGTPVCRQFIVDYPGVAGGICDIDGVYCFYEGATEEYLQALQGFAGMFADKDKCSDNIRAFVGSLAGPETPQEISDYAAAVMPMTAQYVAASTMGHLIEPEWWQAPQITCPAVVLCTQNSGLEADNRERMEALYSDMEYTELTTCGHFIQMEQAELVNEQLVALLNRVYKQ